MNPPSWKVSLYFIVWALIVSHTDGPHVLWIVYDSLFSSLPALYDISTNFDELGERSFMWCRVGKHVCFIILCTWHRYLQETCHVDLHSDPRPTLRCSPYLSTMLCSSLIFPERCDSKLLFDKAQVWRGMKLSMSACRQIELYVK